jgi:hypothetical protein
MTGTATTVQNQAPNLGKLKRSRYVIITIAVIFVLFFLLPVVPVSTQIGLFVGRSPNCASSADCEVNQTGVTLQGYGSASYVLFGIGVPTFYFTTTTVVLATETNASTGQFFGHTAYTITVNGGLDTLRAEANTTAGTISYGCVYVTPNDGAANITVLPSYTTYAYADGTTVQFSNC